MKHCTASARVCLLAVPLVQPHPPPSLHKRLYRRVRRLQAVPEGDVLWTGEPEASRSYRGSKIPPTPGLKVCAVERRVRRSRLFSLSVMSWERMRLWVALMR
jgi:hypothetical protein